MSKTTLRVSLLGSCLLGLAVFASSAEARGFGGSHGGGFGGHGIAVGEPHPGGHSGGIGHHHHGGWGLG